MLKLKPFTFLTCVFASTLLVAQEQYGIVNSGELINQGKLLHDDQKYDSAIALYDQVPENDTNYTFAIAEKAYSYYAKKDYDKAIALCEDALKYGTDYDDNLYSTLGSAYDDWGKPEKAIEAYEKGIKAFPKNTTLLFNKALTLENQKRYQEAADLYKQVLLISPYHTSSHYRLGHLAEQEGDLVRAMLCYNTYLLVNPASSRSYSVLQELNSMVNKKYDNSEAKGIELAENGEDFSEIETLIRKQLALNKKYKLESKADFPVTRQNQALFSYLINHKGNQGFWEKLYVPLYAKIYNEKKFANFSYYILSSGDNAKIQSLLKKNKAGVAKFTDWLGSIFREQTSKRVIDIEGKPTEVTQVYQKGGKLYGVGVFNTGTEKKEGYWTYYHVNGRLMSEGLYDAKGLQTGLWSYYHANGVLRKTIEVKDDKGEGKYKIYYTNGNLKEDGFNKNNELDSAVKSYSYYGGLQEIVHFKNDQRVGKYDEYHNNGQLKFTTTYVANKTTGEYKSYYADGKPYITGNLKNGLKEGLFTVYFRDGKVKLTKNYLLDKEEGETVEYFNNGKINQQGSYKNGNSVGTWESYSLNGNLDQIYNYNDAGKQNGVQQEFDVDGKLFYEVEVKDGRLVQYKYLDKSGKTIIDIKLKSKNDVQLYYADGSLHLQGVIENGRRVGLWKEFSRNGILVGEYNYEDGALSGASKEYFLNGQLHVAANYKDGDLQGEYLEYYVNGQLYKSAWYEIGVGQGNVTKYRKTGSKESFYTLLDDDIHGNCYSFDVESKLTDIEKFDRGVLTERIFFDTTGEEIKTLLFNKEKTNLEFPSISGDIVWKTTFINDSKEGVSHNYFLDNKLLSEGTFLDNERDGIWKWYNPDNTLLTVRNYVSGDLQGVSENYDLFGKIRSRVENISGEKYGIQTYFYYDGKTKEETEYWEGDEHGADKYYGYNGEHVMTLLFNHGTLSKVVYINGKGGKPDTVAAPVNGTVEAKYANGKTAFIIDFKNAYWHGRYREFFEDGTPSREAENVNNQWMGDRKTYYRNGKLRSVEKFNLGDYDGATVLYNENGTKKAELSYKDDMLNGSVKYYDASGKLIASYVFYNGDMIKKVL